MKARSVILYWVLLLVPTLAISMATFRLLAHEEERVRERERYAAQSRAEALADTLQLGIAAVQDELLDLLRVVSEDETQAMLEDWERNNPLVRHTFVWQPGSGLIYPPTDALALNSAEARFAMRYDGLFAGRVKFEGADVGGVDQDRVRNDVIASVSPVASSSAQANAPLAQGQWDSSYQQAAQTAQPQATSKQPLYQRVQKLKVDSRAWAANTRYNNAQQQQREVAQTLDNDLAPQDATVPALLDPTSGWMPWFSENRLDLLGWIQYRPNGKVFGVELEMMAVLSRLIELLQGSDADGAVVVVRNGLGDPVHQAGGVALALDREPTAAVALDPALPHWQLELFAPSASSNAERSFMALSLLLLGIFVVAIVSGGGLLTWQAVRNSRDALQKTSFVSNVSHELKTPLTSIRMYAELMNEGRVANPEKQSRYLGVIADESQRLTRLVNNVLEFGRLEQGRKKYQIESFDLAPVLEAFVGVNRMRLEDMGMTLSLQQPVPSCCIHADRDAVEQVFLNLVDNAAKYACEGGVVELVLSDVGDGAQVHVLDRGPGIARTQRMRIFEKFHRIDNSLTASQPGSGLGLSIARGLLRDLGGELLYKPREGGGSCFTIVLKKAQGA